MKKNILLVEENQAISFLIKTLLEQDCHTIHASNSNFAMKELFANKSFDLIMITIDDASSHNFNLLQHIRTSSMLKQIPVLILSGKNDMALHSACINLDISGFFHKPFNPSEFRDAVNTITEKQLPGIRQRKKLQLFNFSFTF